MARPREIQVVTVRMPKEEHEALKIYAFHTGSSVNDVVLRAVRNYLATEGRSDEFDKLLNKARAQYRVALDKLKDL
jgi:NRPS condensation-like uncharacterized protein